jgi:hypothetical protein
VLPAKSATAAALQLGAGGNVRTTTMRAFDRAEMPGGFPTVVAVDEPVGYYVRDELQPDGRWQMAWRGFGTGEQ